MSNIINNVKKQQAHCNTKYHCLYAYYFQGLKKNQLARIYCKSITTITSWINKYEQTGCVERKKQAQTVYRKFGEHKRSWLVQLYEKTPILYHEEASALFFKEFQMTISSSSISVILHQAGLTWKILEQRAIQIKNNDIVRFCREMRSIRWLHENLVFLDEISFDGKDLQRKHGYGIRGQRLIHRAEFTRGSRVSALCFLGVNGIINTYTTEGTFTRRKFAEACMKMALDEGSPIRQYPGQLSIWILDGAKIHCSSQLIVYLRSLGIIPIFLPAYCAFFNPIELIFGLVKRQLKKDYGSTGSRNLVLKVSEVLNSFMEKNCRAIFKKCGYGANGSFDPSTNYENDLSKGGFNN